MVALLNYFFRWRAAEKVKSSFDGETNANGAPGGERLLAVDPHPAILKVLHYYFLEI
jgi:hypothetical protein